MKFEDFLSWLGRGMGLLVLALVVLAISPIIIWPLIGPIRTALAMRKMGKKDDFFRPLHLKALDYKRYYDEFLKKPRFMKTLLVWAVTDLKAFLLNKKIKRKYPEEFKKLSLLLDELKAILSNYKDEWYRSAYGDPMYFQIQRKRIDSVFHNLSKIA